MILQRVVRSTGRGIAVARRTVERRRARSPNGCREPHVAGESARTGGVAVRHLVALADNGRQFAFARYAANIADPPVVRSRTPADCSEFAGVTFSDDGRTLFANCQTLGHHLCDDRAVATHRRGVGDVRSDA
jgi:hypothetical protein